MIKMNCKQIIKLNFSLLSIIIWLITEMNNSLSKQVRATPAFISTSNTICWMKRFKRASQFDDYTGLYGQYNDGQFSDHQQDYNDDLILHQQYYNNNMIYNNMHQNSYQHKNDFTNSAFDINDDSNIDSSLVGFAGLLSHELSEQYNVARHSDLPKFGEPIQNVTVPVGREAVLQCVIDNLQTYKIAWLRVDTQTILTIQNHVITKNHRMSIMHAEQRAWILRIRDVKESDKGWYMCQINTDPMKSQVGYLDVVVPPDILDFQTSTDMVIHEGSNVTLKCAATGSPVPTITWRRESGELIPTPNGTEVISYNGSFLSMANVNRLTMGAYLCIASNGIPPTVSKRIMLIVHFPPMIWIQNQLVGAAVGQNITLKCQLEAFPKSINYWTKNDTIIVPGERFIPETLENGYKITMRLLIIEVNAHNFGPYRCVAKNSLGDTDGAIKLYHIPQTTTITTTTPEISTNTALINIFNKEQHSNFPQHKHTNKNNVIVNNNNKLERIKSRDEFPQLQQQRKQYRQKFQRHFNGHADATSNVWNMEQGYLSTYQKKQQHRQPEHKVDHFITGEQHYSKNSDHNAQDAEFNNYNYNSVAVGVNYKKSLQHGATNSLILDHNGALQNGAIATSHNLTIVFYLSIYVYTFFHQYIYGNSNKCCRSNTNNNNKNNEQQLHSRAGSTPKYFILLYLFR